MERDPPRKFGLLALTASALFFAPLVSLSIAQMSPLKPIQLPPTTILMGFPWGFVTWWLVPPALFMLLTRPSLRRPERRPFATVVALAASVAASAAWYKVAWPDAINWQGAGYLWTTITMNASVATILVALLAFALYRPSFRRTFVVNVAFACWLSWYPFPWLGEWP